MDRTEAILRQLGLPETEQPIVNALYTRYEAMALAICNRKTANDAIADIVQDIAAGAYQQRGGEGFTSSSTGGQSYAFQDLNKVLKERLISSGQRLGRF